MLKNQSVYEPPLTKHITLLQALASTPATLARILEAVDEAVVRQVPLPGEWSMADILNHLVDVETRYYARLQEVIQKDRPVLPVIEPDEVVHDPHACLAELMVRFRAARTETLAFLGDRSIEDWQRSAVHETFGETNFRCLVQNLVDHDTVHVNQLLELQQQLSSL